MKIQASKSKSPSRQKLPVLPADSPLAPSLSKRAYVGGVLYIEGIITALIGIMLMTAYWPPITAGTVKANPVSRIGLFITVAAVSYLIIAGIAMFFYNLKNPHRAYQKEENETSLQRRARRYAATKDHLKPYLFDEAIHNETDADEAYLARKTLW